MAAHPYFVVLIAAILVASAGAARAHDGPVETSPPADRDKLIEMGAQIHGGFGSLIALGLRIGDDALRRMNARPRDLDVTYYNGAAAPCACAVDGVIIGARASPGQGTLRVSPEPAPDGAFGRVVIRHRKSGLTVEYLIPMSAWPMLRDANALTAPERWEAVMRAEAASLFTTTILEAAKTP